MAKLAGALSKSGLSGFEMRDLFVDKSDTFTELYPDRDLPEFRWLHVCGASCADDFGLPTDNTLIVSSRAYELLKQFEIANCDVNALT